ncbi:carbohydrate ABC transporter permease [Hungatella effluvii]|nr:carbohydrate ABC transporter permease [Hungatella effluvii]
MAFLCFLPLWITFASSISNETAIVKNGFSLLPQEPTLETYRYILKDKGTMIIRAFGVSFAVIFLGTLYSLFIMTTFAYTVAQKKEVFRFSSALSFFAWFTTVFSGGILPWYILMTRYYGLQNNLFALFVPYGMNVFYMFVLKNSFKAIPEELIEAARIDGATSMKIFTSIAIPLAKVGLVTVILFMSLQYWNDFHLSLYLITKSDLYTVQKLLYNMMANISALLSGTKSVVEASNITIPSNTARMVMTMLTVLPVVAFFPFAQKYFVKGITVGAVKG